MDGLNLPEHNHEDRLVQYLQARFDAPAYVRRALQVQQTLDQLLARCRLQRETWLKEGKQILEDLALLVGSWDDLSPWLPSSTDRDLLPHLVGLLATTIVFRPHPAPARRLRRSLARLVEWLEAFNHRWNAFLLKLNLQPINDLRDGYNRYYVLEKECALRSARLARQGFQRLQALTVGELLKYFPLLPVPQLAGRVCT
jgi:hypothetical protein